MTHRHYGDGAYHQDSLGQSKAGPRPIVRSWMKDSLGIDIYYQRKSHLRRRKRALKQVLKIRFVSRNTHQSRDR
jgi:hypothetical protein